MNGEKLWVFGKDLINFFLEKTRQANYDNRVEDFESLSGNVINEMANRGIINSSVTGKALGSAVAEAENNYWNDQMKLLGYSYGTDKKGIAEDLSSTFTKSFVKSIF